MSILTISARIIIALVFLLSGVLKLVDLHGFLGSVKHYELFGDGLLALSISYTIPWIEILAALSLFWKPMQRSGWAILAGLLLAFLALNLFAWAQGLPGDCGCFGKWDVLGKSHSGQFLRNLVFLYILWLGRPCPLLGNVRKE